MKKKTLFVLTVLLAAVVAGMAFAWRGRFDAARRSTEQAYKEAAAVFDGRLPAIAPKRYEETKERTVKTREAVHEEAKTLSGDASADALNSELMLYDPGIRFERERIERK